MSAADQLGEPTVGLIGLSSSKLDHGSTTLDQQRSKIDIATFADAQHLRLAATGVLMRHQADPRGELPRVLEVARAASDSANNIAAARCLSSLKSIPLLTAGRKSTIVTAAARRGLGYPVRQEEAQRVEQRVQQLLRGCAALR